MPDEATALNKRPGTSVIILTHDNLACTQGCIESLRRCCAGENCEIIVVDNGSADGTPAWLREQKDLICLFNKDNAGFPKGCNQGIGAAAPGNDILLLNNDTVVTKNFLKNLKTCLYSANDIGAAGAVTNACSNFQVEPCSCATLDEMLAFAEKNNLSNPARWEERIRLVGFCLLIKRAALENVGLLDEGFSPGNFEDDDYCLRLRMAGYRLMLCHDSFIFHYGSASFGRDSAAFMGLLAANRLKFAIKWGMDPYLFLDERASVEDCLPETAPESVLHIGCGGGGTLAFLRYRYPRAALCGVERDRRLNIGLLHIARIETDLKAFSGMRFGLILLSAAGLSGRGLLEAVAGALAFARPRFRMIVITPRPSQSLGLLPVLPPGLTARAGKAAFVIDGAPRAC